MSLTTLKLGGVPEHFNLPIHLAREKGEFASKGIDLQWRDFKGGTGQMTKALDNQEVDACILLTEGIIHSIIKGAPSNIISLYVKSPLIWGVHTGAQNSLKYYKHIYDKRYAISRKGSGSHLMAIVDANLKGREIVDDQWVVVQNLEGALNSLQEEETDVFYWEKFTTQPYVDKGLLRRVGEFLTPWPCFVIAASEKILTDKPNQIRNMLEVIHNSNSEFMKDPQAIAKVSDRYGITTEDAEQWFHSTEWATHGWVSNKMLESVCYYLKKAGLIPDIPASDQLVWQK